MPRLYLASTSRYRRELLERLGIPFEVRAPLGVDERSVVLPPRETATTLARAKAKAVADTLDSGIVIGSDQVAALGDRILHKPGTTDRACQQLRELSGFEHELITAVCIMDAGSGACREHVDIHRITLRELTDLEIADYVNRDTPTDCAGSYKVESLGIALMDTIQGKDFTAIVGLPLIAVRALLHEFDVHVLGSPP